MKYRGVFVSVMGVMTLTTINSFSWQYTKYRNSTKKWQQIEQNLKQRKVLELSEFQQLLENKTIDELEFQLVRLDGHLVKLTNNNNNNHNSNDNNNNNNNDNLEDYVYRFTRSQESRMGQQLYSVLASRAGENKQIIYIGWVEQNQDISQLSAQEYSDRLGIVRMIRKQKKQSERYFDKDGFNQIIDYQKIKEQNGIEQGYFIEVLQDEQYDKQREFGIYPVQAGLDTFQRPYLMPSTHRDYAIFWGSCTMLGLFSIFKAVV